MTLRAPAQNYLKYCFSELVTVDYLCLKEEHFKPLARGKLF